MSVKPISTCLASLVTRGSDSPASRAARPRELDRLAEPAEAGRIETGLDRVEQLGDAGLGRILPLRLGDQVDLPAVQSLRDDLGAEATLGEPRHGELGGSVECLVLGRRRLPAGNQPQPIRVGDEHLGAAIHAQVEAAGPFGTCAELVVDVLDVRPRDHGKVHAVRGERLHELAEPRRVCLPVGNGGSVPVEDDGLEAAVERRGQVLPWRSTGLHDGRHSYLSASAG